MKPREHGFWMPGEFEPQDSIWLVWPHDNELWIGYLEGVQRVYLDLLAALTPTEKVNLLVPEDDARQPSARALTQAGVRLDHLETHVIPYNDGWIRDNGPIFLVNKLGQRMIVDWGFNAWGDKPFADDEGGTFHTQFEDDDLVPLHIARLRDLRSVTVDYVLEGGSIDVNGEGVLLTTEQCLLNPNRNGIRQPSEVEPLLCDYFGVEQVAWLPHGLIHDHTDGHVDNVARFIDRDHVLLVMPEDPRHPDAKNMVENRAFLESLQLRGGRPLRVSTIPLFDPLELPHETVAPSLANFIIGNKVVVAPTYGQAGEESCLSRLQELFPSRRVIPVAALDLLTGGGSLHCISQQEPRAWQG